MKKFRLAVITAGLIAVLSGLTATADCRSGESCGMNICERRGTVCTNRISDIDLQSFALRGIDTAKCGMRMYMQEEAEEILHRVTKNICQGDVCTNVIIEESASECASECKENDECTEGVCSDSSSDGEQCVNDSEQEFDIDTDSENSENIDADSETDIYCSDNCNSENEDTCTDCADNVASDAEPLRPWAIFEEFFSHYYDFNVTDTDTDENLSEVVSDSDIEDTVVFNAYEQEVCNLVNDIRRQYGLSELAVSDDLTRAARIKSQDMKDKGYFSHTSPTYGSPFDMMKSFGISYRAAGENIAMGQRTPREVVNDWMNSEGHRANILNTTFTQIGVGYVEDGNYWTQLFIG